MNKNTAALTPDTRQDYQIAADELAALFVSLGLTATVTGAHAAIDPAQGKEGREWPHVAVTVTISRHGSRESFDWKMGVGWADWAGILKRTHVSSDDYQVIKAMAGHGSLIPAAQALIAGKYLPAFVAKVNPAEVLARACADAQRAETSFEDWAAEYGYDTDSRKAEAVYFACQTGGIKARKLVDRATFTKLAELANRL